MSDGVWTGGCLCGAVTYSADGEPIASLICHCRDCQRASGAAGVPVVVMPKAGFVARGIVASHAVTGGSGQPTRRHFCPVCGSLLFGMPEHAPGIVTLYAGSLDEPSRFRPSLAQFTGERHALAGHGATLVEHAGRADRPG